MPTEAIFLNNIRILKNAFSVLRRRFFFIGDFMSFVTFFDLLLSHSFAFFAAIITLAVAFVNGWTDAPNAIATGVSTRSIKMHHAVLLASVADFSGAIIIGILNSRVTDTVMNIADFGTDKKMAVIALGAAMSSVVIWSVSAWK